MDRTTLFISFVVVFHSKAGGGIRVVVALSFSCLLASATCHAAFGPSLPIAPHGLHLFLAAESHFVVGTGFLVVLLIFGKTQESVAAKNK